MQQLTFIKPGQLEWWDVLEPKLEGPKQAIVRPVAVATCDLDAAIIQGRVPFRGPFAFGHEFVAEVVEVGEEVKGIRPGQRVIVPFQISCGECRYCLRGQTGDCANVKELSSYGLGNLGGKWGGALSELVRVPFAEAMLVALPPGINPASVASASDNLPDAWRTVGPYLEQQPESPVLIAGGGMSGSIGLYAVGIAKALGASQIDYLDNDLGRLELAKSLGANPLEFKDTPPIRLGRYPITVDASANPASLAAVLRSTEPGGVCTSIGIYYGRETPLPLLEMYTSGLTFKTGRAMARPAIPKILELVQSGQLQPQQVTSEQANWGDAAEALLHYRTKLIISRD